MPSLNTKHIETSDEVSNAHSWFHLTITSLTKLRPYF